MSKPAFNMNTSTEINLNSENLNLNQNHDFLKTYKSALLYIYFFFLKHLLKKILMNNDCLCVYVKWVRKGRGYSFIL